jgi:hypothetical protein
MGNGWSVELDIELCKITLGGRAPAERAATKDVIDLTEMSTPWRYHF